MGAGIPYGLAEDCADYTVWLTLSGLDGVSVFCRAGRHWIHGRSTTIKLMSSASTIVPADLSLFASSLFAAPSLSDQLLLQTKSAANEAVIVSQVDEPLLLVAGVALTSEIIEESWMVEWHVGDTDESVRALCRRGICMIWAQDDKSVFHTGAVDVTIRSAFQELEDQLHVDSHACYQQGVWVAPKDQEFLESYMARTWVPGSEGSRLTGAGAGLTDND